MELRSENERWSIPAPDMEASPLTAEGMRELEADFSKVKIVKYIRDVEFANIDGVSLELQLLLPSTVGDGEKRPLVLFIRGSAWQKRAWFRAFRSWWKWRGAVLSWQAWNTGLLRDFISQLSRTTAGWRLSFCGSMRRSLAGIPISWQPGAVPRARIRRF